MNIDELKSLIRIPAEASKESIVQNFECIADLSGLYSG